eukprot:966576-Rhodomonas_salina.1
MSFLALGVSRVESEPGGVSSARGGILCPLASLLEYLGQQGITQRRSPFGEVDGEDARSIDVSEGHHSQQGTGPLGVGSAVLRSFRTLHPHLRRAFGLEFERARSLG